MRKRHVSKQKMHHTSSGVNFVRTLFSIYVVLVQVVLPVAPALADETAADAAESRETTTSESRGESSEPVNSEQESEPENKSVKVSIVAPDEAEEGRVDAFDNTSENPGSLESENSESLHEPDTSSEDGADTVLSSDESPEHSVTDSSAEDIETVSEEDDASEELEDETLMDGETGVPGEEESPVDALSEDEGVGATEDEVLIGGEGVEASEEEVSADVPLEELEEVLGTTTLNMVQPELHTVSTDNMYTFDTSDCARVADGSFYCTPESEGVAAFTDRVFAAPDSDGDNEIFIEKDGEISQLTFNLHDDSAPFFDDRSDTIVYHRLVGARYQIVSLDLEDGAETQLTFDSYNNMQPTRFDDLIVWQGWVGNDWEIIMSEGGEVRMLTDNTNHDIGPRINGEYIIWQAEKGDGWEVRVYNTLTGMTESIDDTNGASIENPRLVLVYDAKHENGDVETRGYDLVTGKNIALHSEASKLPDELPDPDQTGEDRALITATQQKTKTEDEEGEPELDTPPFNDIVPGLDVSEELTEDDIVIPPFVAGTTTDAIDDVFVDESGEPIHDLVIAPLTVTPEEYPVPDLVIPSLDEESIAVEDSQG